MRRGHFIPLTREVLIAELPEDGSLISEHEVAQRLGFKSIKALRHVVQCVLWRSGGFKVTRNTRGRILGYQRFLSRGASEPIAPLPPEKSAGWDPPGAKAPPDGTAPPAQARPSLDDGTVFPGA